MAKRRRVEAPDEAVHCFYCGGELVGDELRCPHCRKVFREGKIWAAAGVTVAVVVLALAYVAFFAPSGAPPNEPGTTPVYAYSLTTSADVRAAEPGGDVGFVLLVTNLGNVADIVDVETTLPSAAWSSAVEPVALSLGPGTTGVSVLRVTAPAGAALITHDLTVSVQSRGSPTTGASRDLEVVVIQLADQTAATGDKVQVDYTLWLTDGTEKDSSIPRGVPLKVYVGPTDPDPGDEYTQVIEGFWEAIRGMKPGETVAVRIPPEKAYSSGELAGQTLIFAIELLSIDG